MAKWMLTIQHRLTEGPNRELYLSLHAKTRCWGANCCAGLAPIPLKLTAPAVLIVPGPETGIAIGNERGSGGAGSETSTRTGAGGVAVGTGVTERGPTLSRPETVTVTMIGTATGTVRDGANETESGIAPTGTARTGTDVANARMGQTTSLTSASNERGTTPPMKPAFRHRRHRPVFRLHLQ